MSAAELDPARYEPYPGTNEAEVLDLLMELEQPLFSALRAEYPEKGWRVCGPASIVLAHIVRDQTGVPLYPSDDAHEEHLTLVTGFYLPRGRHEIRDHTHLNYYPGARDEVFYIDPAGPMQFGEKPAQDPYIEVGVHYATLLEFTMWNDYSLDHFKANRARQFNKDLWTDGEPTSVAMQQEMVGAMHDGRAFQDVFETSWGGHKDVSAYWGSRLVRVMRNTLAHLNAPQAGFNGPLK